MWARQAEKLAAAGQQPSDSKRWTDAILERALDSQQPPDYDTARTLAWLLKYAVSTPSDEANTEAEVAWNELDSQLGLSIPHGSASSVAEVCDLGGEDVDNGPALQGTNRRTQPAATRPATVSQTLPQTLRARANYDPVKFQQAIQRFADSARTR